MNTKSKQNTTTINPLIEVSIQSDILPKELKDLLAGRGIDNDEDIIILDGTTPIGYIIPPDAYEFFEQKVEECLDIHDEKSLEDFNSEDESKQASSFSEFSRRIDNA